MPAHVAFATDGEHRGLTPDDRLVSDHLERHGLRVTAARWDDAGVDWSAFDLIVIRSCWDYHLRLGEFEGWLDRLESSRLRTQNPIPTLCWNSRKTYLEDLRAAGFDVVPTVYLRHGVRLEELMDRLGSDELVIKPTVGASAHGLWAASRKRADEQQGRLDAEFAATELMAQPKLREIENRGEWSLIYFGGGFSHAVNKRPAAGELRVQEEHGGKSEAGEPIACVRAAADRLVTWLSKPVQPPLYARVDLVEVDGKALLMELELIEPWLFFHTDPRSSERFYRALLRHLS